LLEVAELGAGQPGRIGQLRYQPQAEHLPASVGGDGEPFPGSRLLFEN